MTRKEILVALKSNTIEQERTAEFLEVVNESSKDEYIQKARTLRQEGLDLNKQLIELEEKENAMKKSKAQPTATQKSVLPKKEAITKSFELGKNTQVELKLEQKNANPFSAVAKFIEGYVKNDFTNYKNYVTKNFSEKQEVLVLGTDASTTNQNIQDTYGQDMTNVNVGLGPVLLQAIYRDMVYNASMAAWLSYGIGAITRMEEDFLSFVGNIKGGWVKEGGEKPQGNHLKKFKTKLVPKKYALLSRWTDELIRFGDEISLYEIQYLIELFMEGFTEDYDMNTFWDGDGDGRPLGILSPTRSKTPSAEGYVNLPVEEIVLDNASDLVNVMDRLPVEKSINKGMRPKIAVSKTPFLNVFETGQTTGGSDKPIATESSVFGEYNVAGQGTFRAFTTAFESVKDRGVIGVINFNDGYEFKMYNPANPVIRTTDPYTLLHENVVRDVVEVYANHLIKRENRVFVIVDNFTPTIAKASTAGTDGAITATLTTSKGKPSANKDVEAYNKDGMFIGMAKTDAKGALTIAAPTPSITLVAGEKVTLKENGNVLGQITVA